MRALESRTQCHFRGGSGCAAALSLLCGWELRPALLGARPC